MIANNTYGDLGHLSSKKVGNNTQNINFAYNVRGWLTDINNTVALKQETDPKDLFAFKINYDNINSGISGVKALYNGNISETSWATNSDNGTVRSYGYKYDNLNRLKEGIFQKAAVTTNAYNEIRDGVLVDFYENGAIKSFITKSLQASESQFFGFYSNGILKSAGFKNNGLYNGYVYYFGEDGKLEKKIFYDKGKVIEE